MITNHFIFDTLILSSIFILVGIINTVKDLRKQKKAVAIRKKSKASRLLYLEVVHIIAPILVTLLAVLTYQKAQHLGIIIYSILFIVIIGDFIYRIIPVKVSLKYQFYIVLFEFAYIIFTPIIGFPVYYLSTQFPQNNYNPIETVDIIVFQQNLLKIKNQFMNEDNLLPIKTEKFDSLYSIIIGDIQEKNLALQNLNEELFSVQQQLEYYRTLVNVSEAEAQAIIELFESNKFLDSLLAFVIGCFSSLVATFLFKITIRKLKSTDSLI